MFLPNPPKQEDINKNYRIGNKLYTWKGGEWRYRVLISKTVQYIGTIDMVNNVLYNRVITNYDNVGNNA